MLKFASDVVVEAESVSFRLSDGFNKQLPVDLRGLDVIVMLNQWPSQAEVLFTHETNTPPAARYYSKMTLETVILNALLHLCPGANWPTPSGSVAKKPVAAVAPKAKAKEVDSDAGSDGDNDMDISDDPGSDAGSYPSGSQDFDNMTDPSFSDVDSYEEGADEAEEHMCSELVRDVEQYHQHFGNDHLRTQYSMGRNMTDVCFSFDPSDYIAQATADAWGVHLDLPIMMLIRISAPRYRDLDAPKVEIWQQGAKTSEQEMAEEAKMEEDLHIRAKAKEEELRALHYPNGVPAGELPILQDMVVKSVPGYTPGHMNTPKARPYNAGRFGLQSQLTKIMSSFLNKYWKEGSSMSSSLGIALPKAPAARPDKSIASQHLTPVEEVNVQQLVQMGYPSNKALAALRQAKGSIEGAVDLLANPNFKASLSTSGGKSSTTAAPKRTKKKKVKAEIDWNSGFLVALGSYFTQRFATVNDYCVICDMPHIGVGAALLKPCVCTRDLCCWSFQQLGVGSDASNEIATPVDVTDLLVSMVVAAAKSSRNNQILDPFPTIFDTINSAAPVLSPENKDWTLLNKIVAAICSVDSKLAGAWRHNLQKAHPLAWPLLNWITSSNRSHLVRLPPTYVIPSMGTPYQYLLISAPPEKEAIFQRNKKQHGSHWAFHGSNPENWHSILRRGLINASGTSLQLNGAAYGSGIYLSPAASISFGYSRMHGAGNHSNTNYTDPVTGLADPLRPQDTNHCIALCEVVNNRIRKSGDIWVQEDPDNVVTRIFFAYPKGVPSTNAQANHTNQAKFLEEIENAAKFFVQQAGEADDDSDDEYED